MPATQPYDRAFFDNLREGACRSAGEIVPIVIDLLHPRSVVDVGCGTGDWLMTFALAGVQDVFGVDGPWAEPVAIPRSQFARVDLRSSFLLDRTFDLAVSLEVAEHLPPECAEPFVDSLVRLAPVVLFSAAIPHQGGTDHRNEQWPAYWDDLFDRRGYIPIDYVRPRVWTNDRVEWWYAQNILIYADREFAAAHPILMDQAIRTDRTRLQSVHPRNYLNIARERDLAYVKPDPSRFSASALIRIAPTVFVHAVRRRLHVGRSGERHSRGLRREGSRQRDFLPGLLSLFGANFGGKS